MSASTNLVFELGILIYIFPGSDYVVGTLFFNVALVLVATLLIALLRRHLAASEHGDHDHDHGGGDRIDIQKYVAWLAIFVLITGMLAFAL